MPQDEKAPHHVIFVNDVKQVWDRDIVLAREIVERAGKSPADQFLLELLDHKDGKSVKDFRSSDQVDLSALHEKFFRISPGGGGFS